LWKESLQIIAGILYFLAFKQCRSIEKADKAVRQRGMAKKKKAPLNKQG